MVLENCKVTLFPVTRARKIYDLEGLKVFFQIPRSLPYDLGPFHMNRFPLSYFTYLTFLFFFGQCFWVFNREPGLRRGLGVIYIHTSTHICKSRLETVTKKDAIQWV